MICVASRSEFNNNIAWDQSWRQFRNSQAPESQSINTYCFNLLKFHSFSPLRLQFEWPHANTKLKKCYWHKFKNMAQWNIVDTKINFVFHHFTETAHLWPDALRWQDVLFLEGFPMVTDTKAVVSTQLDPRKRAKIWKVRGIVMRGAMTYA